MTSHQIKSETVLLLVWRFVSVSGASGVAGAAREPGVISRSLMSFNEDFPLQIGLEQGGRREVRRFRLRCVGPGAVNEPSRSFTVPREDKKSGSAKIIDGLIGKDPWSHSSDMIFADKCPNFFHIYLPCLNANLSQWLNRFLVVKLLYYSCLA